MPVRNIERDQAWLFPPSLDDLVPMDHPARFIAAVVDTLEPSAWHHLGIDPDGTVEGAPAYHPRLLLGVWLLGFMTRTRSTRKLETACREQLPYFWLSGRQCPDHNTLWRFYQAHRTGMRKLFKRTVRTAVRLGLVDLAVQAVDGTKMAGNASRERTFDRAGLERLVVRTEQAIGELEAQNQQEHDGEPAPVRLPAVLADKRRLQGQVRAALKELAAEEVGAGTGDPATDPPTTQPADPQAAQPADPATEPQERGERPRRNLTDRDARLMKGRHGYVAGYNAQAMVSPVAADRAGRTGRWVTAEEVVTDPDDHGQVLPMLAAAAANVGQPVAVSEADGGYHSGETLTALEELGQVVLMPEAQGKALAGAYHKDAFTYGEEEDSYRCPEGKTLLPRGTKERPGRPVMRVYRIDGGGAVCRECVAFGQCTRDGRQGRAVEVGPNEAALRRQRERMRQPEAKAQYRRRKELPEPVFGIVREQMGVRQFLLRGLEGVRAEWGLVMTAFNLLTFWRIWRGWTPEQREVLVAGFRST